MINTNGFERLRFLGRMSAFILFLIIISLVLQQSLTEFWILPTGIRTKLGVTAYELIILIAACVILMCPAYLLFRFGCSKLAHAFLFVISTGIVLLAVSSWLFYEMTERFLGTYAMQMLVSDGNQIWGYLFKLPSLLDPETLAGLSFVLICVFILTLSRSSFVKYTHHVALYCLPLVTIVSLGLSIAFDSPEKTDDEGAEWGRAAVEEVRVNEYSRLKHKVGPFSAFSESVLSTAVFRTSDETIDTSKLTKRGKLQSPSSVDIKKHNVVFIVVESMRPDALGVYGGVEGVMPTVNELGKSAYVFNRAYSQASHSNYAYVSAMSGQYPLRSKNIHFYPKSPTYPKSLPYDVLKPLGYDVGLFGSHNDNWGNMSNYLNSSTVDIYSHVGSDDSMDDKRTYSKVKVQTTEDGKTGVSFGEFMYQSATKAVERLDEETVSIAIDWLDSTSDADPFFMYLNLQAAHQPFDALPEGYVRKFLTDDNDYAQKVKNGFNAGLPLMYVAQAYMDALHYVDSNIEAVVNQLKIKGLHENTIYVVTSDTAIQIDGGFLGNGGSLNPEVIRIPMLISVPEKKATEMIKEPVEQIDIMPTVLSLIGAGPHPASQGVDIISNRDPDRLIYSLAQTPMAHQYSVIYKGWQLLHDYNNNVYTINYIDGVAPEEGIDSKTSEWMRDKLNEWKRAQLAYYSDESVHSEYYPPKYNDSSWNGMNNLLITAEENDL